MAYYIVILVCREKKAQAFLVIYVESVLTSCLHSKQQGKILMTLFLMSMLISRTRVASLALLCFPGPHKFLKWWLLEIDYGLVPGSHNAAHIWCSRADVCPFRIISKCTLHDICSQCKLIYKVSPVCLLFTMLHVHRRY